MKQKLKRFSYKIFVGIGNNTIVNITELRIAATTFFNELGVWSYDKWEKLNNLYFGGQLEPGPILWGLTPHGKHLGAYNPIDNQIILHTH